MAITVLLAEDAAEFRAVIRLALEARGGFQVVAEAGTGKGAVEAAARRQPEVVVLDLEMADLAGADLVARLRVVSPEAQVVIYTGASTSSAEAVGANVAGFLSKDRDVSTLVDLLVRLERPAYRNAAVELGPDPGDVAAARRFVADHCRAWGCSELVGDAELVASELVTNALVHTGTRCEFRAGISATALRLQVIDGAAAVPDLRAAGDTDEGGRGLLLVSALCAAWGTESLHSGGKIVWAELLRRPDDPADLARSA